jgi:hypothetical protein
LTDNFQETQHIRLSRVIAALRAEQHRIYELGQETPHPDIAEAGMHLEAAIADLDEVRRLVVGVK